jgi:hypothetical protein
VWFVTEKNKAEMHYCQFKFDSLTTQMLDIVMLLFFFSFGQCGGFNSGQLWLLSRGFTI